MSHPQHHLRVFVDDGPYRGETLSIARDEDGGVPGQITISAADTGGGPGGVTEHRDGGDAPRDRPVSYRFDHADEDNGVWVYRLAPNG